MYEEDYHLNKHNYLHEDEYYYRVRGKVGIEQYFKGIVKIKEKVLEYGCGLGQNIFYVFNATGYDVSKFALEFCKKKGINVTNNLKGLKNFDVILSCEVLEHVEEPLKVLKEMNSKLRKGGKLILVIPIDKWNEPQPFDNNQHLYNWNFNTITNLLLRAGFYPIDYKTLRRTGFKRLLWLNKISFNLYLFFTWLLAIFTSSKHMRIISIKK